MRTVDVQDTEADEPDPASLTDSGRCRRVDKPTISAAEVVADDAVEADNQAADPTRQMLDEQPTADTEDARADSTIRRPR